LWLNQASQGVARRQRHQQRRCPSGLQRGFDFRAIYIAFFGNLVYWFVLIFGFVLWSDRRWRRMRAARIDT
jgi:hypothetical protein